MGPKSTMISITFVLSVLLALEVSARPLDNNLGIVELNNNENNNHLDQTEAMMYLMKYGYMDPLNPSGKSAALLSSDSITSSVMQFQRFAGLNETGILDSETIRMMKMPRCGVKDIVGPGAKARRRKRYALQGSRWRVREISYRISRYPSTKRLSKREVDKEIEKALAVWSEHTDLKFVNKQSGRVHIDIRFERNEHGDGDPFDGRGGTLAHAFFPVFGGDAHFDDAESWTAKTFFGTNLLQTAAHEFGHSLGLSHSDVSSALMAPFYRGYQRNVRLEPDDIRGIQELYGEKKERPVPTTKPTIIRTSNRGNKNNNNNNNKKNEDNDDDDDVGNEELCNDASIDAMVTTKDGTTYAFKGGDYWKLTSDSIASGYPRSIAADWDLPSDLDAAFTWTNGRTYFFKGEQYWRFTDRTMDANYPKRMAEGFEGVPADVDAAFVWSGNEKIYFFKNDKYYKFDPEKKPPVSKAYPKPISNWEGIPNDIDDAIRYSNGYTYFFKEGRYWRFDDTEFKVDEATPSFPRPAGFWWFGCKAMNQGNDNNVDIKGGNVDNGDDDDVGDKDLDAGETTSSSSSLWRRIKSGVKSVFKKIF